MRLPGLRIEVAPSAPSPLPLRALLNRLLSSSSCTKRPSRLAAPSNASASSYSKDSPILNISDSSSSFSEPDNSSYVMSKCKARNLLNSLGNLHAPGSNKASLLNPSSILGKRPPVDSSLGRYSKKAKDKPPTKSSGDFDPLSVWLDYSL
ncbi:hypothetical protein AAC387_Pa02g2071 [Persea americana]